MEVDLLDDDEEQEDTQEQQSNASAAQTRIDREKAKLKKRAEEAEAKVAEFEAKEKARSVKEVFAEVGLNQKWSDFYRGEETSPEAVRAWALANDFLQIEEDAEPEAPAAAPTGYTPTVIQGGEPPAGKMYTRKEMEDIARVNPQRARALADSGKVAWNNPQVSER